MCTNHDVLDCGDPPEGPWPMVLWSTAGGAVGAVAPLLGAGVVVLGGYEASFWATIITMCAALIVMIWKVEEPRRARQR